MQIKKRKEGRKGGREGERQKRRRKEHSTYGGVEESLNFSRIKVCKSLTHLTRRRGRPDSARPPTAVACRGLLVEKSPPHLP